MPRAGPAVSRQAPCAMQDRLPLELSGTRFHCLPCCRGKPILEEEQRQVEAAAAKSFTVNLGGPAGAGRGWGQCLAVLGGDEVGRLRSQLGNVVAEKAKAQGLRGMAVVAYTEVRPGPWHGLHFVQLLSPGCQCVHAACASRSVLAHSDSAVALGCHSIPPSLRVHAGTANGSSLVPPRHVWLTPPRLDRLPSDLPPS
jgi:hypothetical protein